MPLPIAAPALLSLGQVGYQAYQGYKQGQKAKELEEKGPVDNVPAAYKQMLANQANQANNAQIAGYGQAIDNLNEQQATTLGEAKRAGISSSNLMNVLTKLNLQGNAEKRKYAIAGEQAKEQRQGQYNQGLMGQSRIQELARQEQQNAIGALRGASMQNYYNAFTGGIGALNPLIGGIQGMNQAAKMKKLLEKGYTEDGLGGMDISQLSRREIRSLPEMSEDDPNFGRSIPDILRVMRRGPSQLRFKNSNMAPDSFNPYTTTFE